MMRRLLGFIAAWLTAVLVYALAIRVWESDPSTVPAFLIAVGIYAAIYVAVLGIPAYLAIRGLKQTSLLAYCVAGLVCSLPATVGFGMLKIEMGLISLLAGAASGTAFWFVAGDAQQGVPRDGSRAARENRA